MPLQRATKSVIFHDGIADGTDRFLVEPPALDYAENVHPHKDGSFQKRPGFGDSAVATAPNANGEPFFIHGIGDNLHVLTEDGARTWNGDGWEEVDTAGFIGTSEMVLETPNMIGMGNCTFRTYKENGVVAGYGFAYEVRSRSSDPADPTGTPKHVIVQWYDNDRKFGGQFRIENATSPRLLECDALDALGLFYVTTADDQIRYRTFRPFSLTNTPATQFGTEVQTGVFCERRPGNFSFADADPVDLPSNGKGLFTEIGPRLGQGIQGHARYHVAWSTVAARYIVFYRAKYAESLELQRLLSIGIQDGSEVVVQGGAQKGDVYAITAANDFDVVVILYSKTTASLQTIEAQIVVGASLLSRLTKTVSIPTLVGETLATFTHGSCKITDLAEGPPDKVLCGIHYSGLSTASEFKDKKEGGGPIDPVLHPEMGEAEYFYPFNVRDEGARTEFIEWNTVTDTIETTFVYHHRLSTNIERFEGKWYAGLQQWIDYTPHYENPGAMNNYMAVLPSTKGVSTVLCAIDPTSDSVFPVAVCDPGQSAVCDYAESESFIHLSELYEDDGSLTIANRVKVSVEDINLYVGATNSVWRRGSNLEVAADALCRVYTVFKGIGANNSLTPASVGDGLVLPSAVPYWFGGRFFGELSPLDSPEIVRVWDAYYDSLNNGAGNYAKVPPQGYLNDIQTGGSTDWRKFVVITGYTDASGNVHRSAPSSTYYVKEISTTGIAGDPVDPVNGEAGGQEIRVTVTSPLSAFPSSVDYFCEVYASEGLDDDPVLVAHKTIDADNVNQAVQITVFLNRESLGDNSTLIETLRGSKSVYTSGGELAADPWPLFGLSVATSTRLWAIDAVRPGRVIPSKLFTDYIAPEYNSTLAINLGDERDLTAIGKLDDKVVVFEPNDIHVIYGEGPDNRGQGQDFAVHYISTDVGCEDQQSVVETPAGLIFYSKPRGFYMLDRNLQVRFIGDGVEEIARDIDVVASTLVSEFGEVRFIVSQGTLTPRASNQLVEEAPQVVQDAGVYNPPRPKVTNVLGRFPALVYNYEKDIWTAYENYKGSAATIYQNKYTMLLPNWDIWQESSTRYDDPTLYSRMLLRTPWIRLSEQIQNYARLWRVTFLGRYLSSLQDLGGGVYEAGDVIVRAWFDYEAGVDPQEKRYRFQDFGFDPFNAVPLRGERFQFKWTPERGRCQAVKFEIEEVNSEDRGEGLTYALGAGFEIVSADLEVGVAGMQTRYLQAGVSK